MFSGDRERVYWERMGYNGSYFKKKICRQFCIKWPQMKNTSYLFTTQILFMWKFLFLRYIYKKGNVKVFQSFNLRCFLSYWCAPLSLPIKLQGSSKGNIKRSIVYIILIFMHSFSIWGSIKMLQWFELPRPLDQLNCRIL